MTNPNRAPVFLLSPALALLLFVPAARAEDVTTFDALLGVVRAEPDPTVILERCGDTVFTFSPAQRAQLTAAGAPASLIDALGKERMKRGDVQNFALILDCSGSMRERLPDGRAKMDAAKETLAKLVNKIPDGLSVSLTVYGHELESGCKAVQVLRPLGEVNAKAREQLTQVINLLEPAGHTPIAAALRESGRTLERATGLSQVVLVTDGIETCHEDPAAVAEALALKPNMYRVEVVGLGLAPQEKAAVARIARRGRGKYYDAQTA